MKDHSFVFFNLFDLCDNFSSFEDLLLVCKRLFCLACPQETYLLMHTVKDDWFCDHSSSFFHHQVALKYSTH